VNLAETDYPVNESDGQKTALFFAKTGVRKMKSIAGYQPKFQNLSYLVCFYEALSLIASLSFNLSARASSPAPPEERPPVILSLGEQRFLTIPGLARYSLGSPILKALPAPRGNKDAVLLKAVQAGITDLLVWKKDGTTEHRPIEVRAWKRGLVPDLERRMAELREVEVWVTGDPEKGHALYVAQGEVRSSAEATRLGRMLEMYPAEIESRARLSEALYLSGEHALRAVLARTKWGEDLELTADPESRMLLIRGGFPDPRVKSEAEKSLRRACPLASLEIDAMPDRNPTIHFKVFLLELRKNRSRSLGLDFPGLIPNALSVSPLGVHTALSLEAAIHALEDDGSARILSQPELVVRAPGDAELFAGGEIPIESKTAYSSNVQWRSYGLTLKLKVQNVSGRRVRTDIQTEVSHLDPQHSSSDSIPGLQANRMKTQVDATFDQPLFLSGLLQEGVRNSVRGLPLLKDIPILGLLFGSQDFLEDRSELVAILLPSRTLPEAPRIAIGLDRPTGPAPQPRNWISPQEEIAIRSAPDFPWNAFKKNPTPLAGDPDSPLNGSFGNEVASDGPSDFSP